MMTSVKNIILALKDSVFAPACSLTADYIQLGVDEIFENTVLQKIPVINTLTAVCEVGLNIKERNLARQTLSFLQGFNEGSITQEQLNLHRKKLENNPDKLEQELRRVIIILNDHIEVLQSQTLGKFYLSYIKGAISWDKFCELSEANRKMFLGDYRVLHAIVQSDNSLRVNHEFYQADRLASLGLVQNDYRLGEKYIHLTSFGKTFYQHSAKENYK